MARRNRIIKDGGAYHITNRINTREKLLEPAHFKHLFLHVLLEAKTKYRFHIRNITIMDNHVHILIKMEHGQSLSKLMQWVFSVFAMRYNHICGRTGHLWEGRFKSVLLEGIAAFAKVFEYICNNPVKAGITDTVETYAFGYYKLVTSPVYYRLFCFD